jgi:beta-1,4-mannosyl-glycoprotein beta-1,4-N-acetylglucosaminyltransferase
MIWDTFMFRNELDMLQCRLEEFDSCGLPVQHLLVESGRDFHGRPKPLLFMENLERFEPWLDRIVHVVNHTMPQESTPWAREHYQRDCLVSTLARRAHPEDLVLICDVDEIPSRHVLGYAGMPRSLLMRTAHSAVDWLYPAEMPGSVVSSYQYITGLNLSAVRDGRPGYPVMHNGGWHLSWLGGPAAQADKLAVTCHLELPVEECRILGEGHGFRDGHHVGVDMVPAAVDDTWPKYVREHRCPETWFRPQ